MLQRSLAVIFILALAAAGQSTTTKKSTKSPSSATTKKGSTASGQYPTAILHTTAGDMKCELFTDKSPQAAFNFIGLATGKKDWTDPNTGKLVHGKPLYDGVIFHRIIPEFMIQGGDPAGNGSGNPGYKFEDELHPDLLFDRPGRLAMANSGPNTNGSQFFITEKELPSLNPCLEQGGCQRSFGVMPQNSGYTIFGQCDGPTVELVKQIARMPRGPRDYPQNPVKITHIEIQKAGAAGTAPKSSTKKGTTSKKATTKSTAPKQ